MELIKIISEQSSVDYSDWKSGEPIDFRTNPSKYDFKYIKVNNKPVKHYKLKSTSPSTSTVDLSDYVGKYKTNTTPSVSTEFFIDDDKLYFNYGLGRNEELTFTSSDEFTFKYGGQTNTVKFTKGSDNKVNGFDANIFGKTVKGTKEGSSNSGTSGSSGSSGTAGSSGSAGSAGSSGSSGTTTVVNKQYTKYDAITPDDRIKGFKWHDCENKDFPYEFGCKNKQIGQMNKCLFGTTLNGIFGDELWENMKDLAIDNDEKQITLTMYEKVMNNCKQQEESTQKKKIIKENTYKILNQIK
jgi:hypothetical protein